MENKIFAIFLLALTSCANLNLSAPSKIDPNTTYDYDMVMRVDGISYEGFGVLPQKAVGYYDILLETRADIDIVTMDTCSKHLRAERSYNVETEVPILPFWTRKVVDKRKYRFQYAQDQLERSKKACFLFFQAFNAKDGKHSFGQLAVKDPRFTLPAWVTCNTSHENFEGVSMCKNEMNKFTRIEFAEPVIASPELNTDETPRFPKCAVEGMDAQARKFEFHIAPKTCIYEFKSRETGRKHLTTVIGWEDFIPRY